MKMRTAGLVITVLSLSLSFAPAAFACGDGSCEPPPEEKGNNGWGNGADSTNAGSNTGGTQSSKSNNGYGDGPGPTRFTTR